MSDLYFTADLHFGHEFMARLRSERGLLWTDRKNFYGMDEWLVEAWNDRVKKNDEVYVLGDFSWRSNAQETFDSLNGRKYLLRGNHDPKAHDRLGWAGVWDFRRVKWEGNSFWCFHYPMLTWPNAHHGSYHLHGHSHGNLRAPETTRLDVGPDATGQIVMSVQEVLAVMATRSYDFIDHHEKDDEPA